MTHFNQTLTTMPRHQQASFTQDTATLASAIWHQIDLQQDGVCLMTSARWFQKLFSCTLSFLLHWTPSFTTAARFKCNYPKNIAEWLVNYNIWFSWRPNMTACTPALVIRMSCLGFYRLSSYDNRQPVYIADSLKSGFVISIARYLH